MGFLNDCCLDVLPLSTFYIRLFDSARLLAFAGAFTFVLHEFTYEEGDYFSALRWHDDTTRPIHTTFETKTSHGRNETNIMSGDYETGSGRSSSASFTFLLHYCNLFHFLRRALGLHSVLRWGLDLAFVFSVRKNLGSLFSTQK
jgi:hypothetical protein